MVEIINQVFSFLIYILYPIRYHFQIFLSSAIRILKLLNEKSIAQNYLKKNLC